MRKLLNTLHITTQGAYLHRDGETISVKVGNEIKLRLPIHTIESLVCYGAVTCSSFVLGLCCEHGVGVSMLTEQGRFMARVSGRSLVTCCCVGSSTGLRICPQYLSLSWLPW